MKKVFSKEKKQLKSSELSITESLTKLRIGKLAKARDEFEFNVDGSVTLGKVPSFLKLTTIKIFCVVMNVVQKMFCFVMFGFSEGIVS